MLEGVINFEPSFFSLGFPACRLGLIGHLLLHCRSRAPLELRLRLLWSGPLLFNDYPGSLMNAENQALGGNQIYRRGVKGFTFCFHIDRSQ